MPIEFMHTPDAPPPLGKPLVELEIQSHPPEKDFVLDHFLHELSTRGFLHSEEDEMKMRLVLDEALLNAIQHGNKRSEGKKVKAGLYETETQWSLCIEDEGEGFHPGMVPDPDDPQNVLLDHGRGIFLMRQMMDDIRYYRNGACLVLIRNKP